MAEIVVLTAGAYLAIGVGFAVAFVAIGAASVDPSARGATLGFKLAVFPGAALLWPLLARRWTLGQGPPLEDTPHKRQVARR